MPLDFLDFPGLVIEETTIIRDLYAYGMEVLIDIHLTL
jgi:hypothetical protein